MLTLSSILLLVAARAPVSLNRVFTKGEHFGYAVKAQLQEEMRSGNVETFFPRDIAISYQFTEDVLSVTPAGVASIRYRRPTTTRYYGESFDEGERTVVDKSNLDVTLSISPANEILDIQRKGNSLRTSTPSNSFSARLQKSPEEFMGEVFRLALFVGPLESALDLAPRLPLQPVEVGESWKRTLTYAPQAVDGKKAQMAIQRLDYTFTYRGRQTNAAGRSVDRVDAELHLNTDVGAFLLQSLGLTAEATGLKSAPVQLDATIAFDLDPVDHRTLRVVAESKGGIQVFRNNGAERPEIEVHLKGRTTMLPVGESTKKRSQ